jgi:hypothetical protein
MEILIVALVAVGFWLVWRANQTNKTEINKDVAVEAPYKVETAEVAQQVAGLTIVAEGAGVVEVPVAKPARAKKATAVKKAPVAKKTTTRAKKAPATK